MALLAFTLSVFRCARAIRPAEAPRISIKMRSEMNILRARYLFWLCQGNNGVGSLAGETTGGAKSGRAGAGAGVCFVVSDEDKKGDCGKGGGA